MSNAPQTIIGVPGRWATRSDIVTSIVKSSGGYLFAGMILMHMESQVHFSLEVYGRDDALTRAFAIAGGNRLTQQELDEIDHHTFCLYLSGEGGSIDSARRFMSAANALLDCGGLGVKIESAGTAHSPNGWRSLCADGRLGSMLEAFVTYVGNDDGFYSCGMHNLGYPDCVVEAPISSSEAGSLIHTFLGYLLVENPTLNSGETFSVDAEAPRYRVFKETCAMFDPDDPFHNPGGIWKLVPA